MFQQEVSSLQIVRQDIKVGIWTHFLTRKEVCHEKNIMDFTNSMPFMRMRDADV